MSNDRIDRQPENDHAFAYARAREQFPWLEFSPGPIYGAETRVLLNRGSFSTHSRSINSYARRRAADGAEGDKRTARVREARASANKI